MQKIERKEAYTIEDLVRIVEVLRAPGGCPWDREQTHASLRGTLLEEAYEAADAIDQKSAAMLCEELGDVLLQVVFHARLGSEEKTFDFDDVCDGICKKLIYRHPHVFGDDAVPLAEEIPGRWDKLKDAEKGIHTAAQDLSAVPAAMPALMRAQKLQKRAGRHGFTYADSDEALHDLELEMEELKAALPDSRQAEAELGDVFFSAANLARLLGVNAEQALESTNAKFSRRVQATEERLAAQGKQMADVPRAELLQAYAESKKSLL